MWNGGPSRRVAESLSSTVSGTSLDKMHVYCPPLARPEEPSMLTSTGAVIAGELVFIVHGEPG